MAAKVIAMRVQTRLRVVTNPAAEPKLAMRRMEPPVEPASWERYEYDPSAGLSAWLFIAVLTVVLFLEGWESLKRRFA